MAMNGKNRIVIYGPKADGTYIVEFGAAADEARAISMPGSEAALWALHANTESMPGRNLRSPYRIFDGHREDEMRAMG